MTAVVILRSAPSITHIIRRDSIVPDAVVTKCGQIGFLYHEEGHKAWRTCHKCEAVEKLEELRNSGEAAEALEAYRRDT